MKRLILEDLLHWKDSTGRQPLLLHGVRQVGKTYILKRFGKDYFPRCHYLNFEKNGHLHQIFDYDLDPERIIKELSFLLGININTRKDLVIFDEIQECPKALTSLKYFAEEMPELAICSAGSLLGIHLSGTSYPVGKVSLLSLYPMSFQEFLMADNDKKSLAIFENLEKISVLPEVVHKHLWEQFKKYLVVGGMPEVVAIYCQLKKDLFHAFTEVRKKQEDLLVAYFADMAKHSGKVNAMHIDRAFRSVPNQLSNTVNGSAGKYKFIGVISGVSHYYRFANVIDWLKSARLVIKINIVNSCNLPFGGYTKENAFKLFLFDVGILGSMSELSPKTIMDYDYGSYKGFMAENFVAQELLCAGNKPLYSWVERKSKIEFLLQKDGKVVPLEVKSGFVTKAKSLKVFREKYNPKDSVILSAKHLHFNEKRKTLYCPLYLVCYLSSFFQK